MMVDIDDAGQALALARRERTPLPGLSGGLPSNEAEAYAVQETAVTAYGVPRVGYKIGATNPMVQAMLHTDHPFHGPLFAADCHDSGASIALPSYGLIGLEPEFALRLCSDLPAREQAYTLDEVSAAVGSVHPAYEIIGLRLPNELFKNVLVVTADFGANAGFVAGDGIGDWHQYDLSTIAVQSLVEDKEVATGSGGNVLGHPLNALLWLANELAASGRGLSKNDWISTCLLYTSPSPRDQRGSRMPSSA